MDLAEIRKKANSQKQDGVAPPLPSEAEPDAVAFDLDVLEVPPPEEKGGLAQGSSIDPLDALFASQRGLDLIKDEQYLQGFGENDLVKTENLVEWLTFSLGNEDYALDINSIHEIIKPREITDIPRVPEFILGIISLRGIILPVFDLTRRLRLGSAEVSPHSRIIICEYGECTAGLLVDHINQVVRIKKEEIEPPPAVLSGLDRDLIEGVGRQEGKMMILLNLKCVLDPELI